MSEQKSIPKVMTIQEAAQIFFQNKVKPGLIYKAIQAHRLPHVRLSNGKILLDTDELIKWWNDELKKSTISVVKPLIKIN